MTNRIAQFIPVNDHQLYEVSYLKGLEDATWGVPCQLNPSMTGTEAEGYEEGYLVALMEEQLKK